MAKTESILEMFMDQASSVELPQGIHEGVRILEAEPGEPNEHGTPSKKHLYVTFKKYDTKGNDLGTKVVSFFRIDPNRDSALNNLHSLLAKTKDILGLYYTEKEIEKKFDPLKVLLKEDEVPTEVTSEFEFDNIKEARFSQISNYAIVEAEVDKLAVNLINNKAGKISENLRLKLEPNDKGDFIDIPRFGAFVEKMSLERKNSNLYK